MFSFRTSLVILAGLAAGCLAPQAGVAQEGTPQASEYACDADCAALITDWIDADVERRFPSHYIPSERFESFEGTAACSVERDAAPQVHAVVLAPDYPNYFKMASTQNDAMLLQNFFTDRGIDPRFMTVAFGADVTRDRMLTILRSALACVRERDQLVLVMTGISTSYPLAMAPDIDTLVGYRCEEQDKTEALQLLCDNAASLSPETRVDMTNILSDALLAKSERLFATAETKGNYDSLRNDWDAKIVGLGGSELANFVTQVRNRGADAFVAIDASYAAGFDLLGYQRSAVQDGGWFWNPALDEKPAEQDFNTDLTPLFGTGHFAVFYAAGEYQLASEGSAGGSSEPLGQFILTFTETLRQEPDISLSDLAVRVAQGIRESGSEQTPVFSASSTNLRFLAPSAVSPAEVAQAGQIEIISPTPKRGAAGIEEKTFTLVARYDGPLAASKAIIDGEIVDIDANGQFRREITDAGGKLSIQLRVLGRDFSTLAATELKLREAEEEPIIATAARKLALVIANENYGDGGFAPLKTPVGDAEAIATILKQRFGFETSITTGGKALDLFLKDASKAQIQQVLYQLRRQLTPEDQLIVYYAGHGENDPDLGAYWVPVDGLPKADFTWIAADEITRELKRMNAGSVLVISDSCYAGGLSRGAEDKPEMTESRARYLAKASRMKARQLMASGGEEPVEDGGGGGHSVFAKALIEALQSMPDETFTASELFEQKVKPAVISAANSLTEGQTPGFSRIARAGDEPGSEFVFQAVQ